MLVSAAENLPIPSVPAASTSAYAEQSRFLYDVRCLMIDYMHLSGAGNALQMVHRTCNYLDDVLLGWESRSVGAVPEYFYQLLNAYEAQCEKLSGTK